MSRLQSVAILRSKVEFRPALGPETSVSCTVESFHFVYASELYASSTENDRVDLSSSTAIASGNVDASVHTSPVALGDATIDCLRTIFIHRRSMHVN
jgi:hypothetical protein